MGCGVGQAWTRIGDGIAAEQTGPNPKASFNLSAFNRRDPERQYVEAWLARLDEKSEKATGARHEQSMRRSTIAICLSLLALLIAILVLWRKW